MRMRLAVGVGEVHQHLVGAQRQAVLGLELGVERLRQRGVDAEHAAPGAQLAGVELPVRMVGGAMRRAGGHDEGARARW